MDKQKIITYFLLFTDLDQTELSKWESLVDSVITEVNRKRKHGADITNYLDGLHLYTAALAYYRYVLMKIGSGREEVKLGELSFKTDAGEELRIARQIVREFEEPISDILTIRGFFFEGVE